MTTIQNWWIVHLGLKSTDNPSIFSYLLNQLVLTGVICLFAVCHWKCFLGSIKQQYMGATSEMARRVLGRWHLTQTIQEQFDLALETVYPRD